LADQWESRSTNASTGLALVGVAYDDDITAAGERRTKTLHILSTYGDHEGLMEFLRVLPGDRQDHCLHLAGPYSLPGQQELNRVAD
jgi:hypothetical protein